MKIENKFQEGVSTIRYVRHPLFCIGIIRQTLHLSYRDRLGLGLLA